LPRDELRRRRAAARQPRERDGREQHEHVAAEPHDGDDKGGHGARERARGRAAARRRNEEPRARRRIAVPAFVVKALSFAKFAVGLRHQGLLGEDIPARFGLRQPNDEPVFLPRAEQRGLRILPRGAVLDHRAAAATGLGASLRATVLAVIQQIEFHQLAKAKPRVQLQIGTEGEHRAAHRHVLVPGLIGSRAAGQEPLGIVEIF
jgi:hypothetical protein